jgi:hypothetical protein
VDCLEVTEKLLAEESADDPEIERHITGCASCAHVARGLARLDAVLSTTLVVAPPLALQQSLRRLALDAARPAAVPWWRQLTQIDLTQWLARPQMVAAQGLAAVMLALASWQVFGWLSAFQPVVGNVGYAMELVAGSPAVAYVGSSQIDFQSLGIWSLVGIVGWLISDNGLINIGRRGASKGPRLP